MAEEVNNERCNKDNMTVGDKLLREKVHGENSPKRELVASIPVRKAQIASDTLPHTV